MSLTLYFHPLSSFCHKALIALYENDTPFKPHLVDLSNAEAAAAFKKIWPIGKFPVLHDSRGDRIIPESSIVIEYLDLHYPGKVRLVPEDADKAMQARLSDRFYDWSISLPIQRIVVDRLRPAGKNDPLGVEQSWALMKTALEIVDREMASRTWAIGDAFSMADCSAAPALFYVNKLNPFGDKYKNAAAYLQRLMERPSFTRVINEAKPYFALMPQ